MDLELNRPNFINTTTMISVPESTATAKFMFLSDLRFEYSTNSYNNDNTTASIVISFSETITVDRIALLGHNLKSYNLFYNGVTANTFAFSSANTTVSQYATNSETSQYFRCTPVGVTSVTLDMKSTIVANQNKILGYFMLSENRTNFGGRVPVAQSYNPRLNVTAVDHKLSNGTVRSQVIEDNWSTSFGLTFVTEAVRDELREIYDDHESVIFAEFGTSAGWSGVLFPCNWIGSFDFYSRSDNASEAGFTGSLNLVESTNL